MTTRKRPLWVYMLLSLLGISLLAIAGLWLMTRAETRGTLEIRLKDHREAIGDFATLGVSVKVVRLSPKTERTADQAEWKDLRPSVKQVDLTRYTGKDSAVIFNGKLARGHFEAIHLKLDPVKGILKKNQQEVPIENLISPIDRKSVV